ncbi:hypothetical protein [Kitasatospora sp. NPDC094016]|uniref:hypothetical protein n=1 Tax=unclassified Kitasatospora TaxID=2633591 RepID=UPI00331AE6D2
MTHRSAPMRSARSSDWAVTASAAAIALADKGGLEAVSLRRLRQELETGKGRVVALSPSA